MNINKTLLMGRIGKIGEVRYFDNGAAVLSVTLATSEMWKQAGSNERQEHVEWHRLEFRNKDADNISKYAVIGQEMFVEGKARTRSYEGEGGVKQYVHFVEVERFEFGRKPRAESGQGRETGRDSGYDDGNYGDAPAEAGDDGASQYGAGARRPAGNTAGRAPAQRAPRTAGR